MKWRVPSWRTKLILLMVGFMAVTLGCLGGFLNAYTTRTLHAQTLEREQLFARNVQRSINQVLFAGKYQAQAYIEGLSAGEPDVLYVMILDARTHRAIAHSDPARVGERFDDPISMKAYEAIGDDLVVQSYSQANGTPVDDLSLPYVRGYLREPEGVIRIGLSGAAEQALMERTRRVSIALSLCFLAAGALLSIGLGVRLTAQLRRLVLATRRLGSGALDERVATRGVEGDELDQLGVAFNQMAARLMAAAEGLEEQVRERTEQLANANAWLRESEEQLRAQYEQLKQIDRFKSDFVNAVSHDLRTPLTTIMGYAEFLQDEIGGELSESQMAFVNQIDRATRRLEHLVDDLLDFARIEAGTFKLKIEDADLGDKVREIVESLRPQAEEAHLTLRTLDAGSLPASFDPQRIEQVLTNLLHNAIKFTPAGGVITVRAHSEGEGLRCEITDTGPGIAPEDAPKLFQRFSQLQTGMAKGGTGLGLAISKTIVESHGGRIGVESTPGEGATFWFWLPDVPHPAESPV